MTTQPQWHKIRHYNLGQGNNSASANALDGSSEENVGKVIGNASNNRANGEECESRYYQGLAAKDIGK